MGKRRGKSSKSRGSKDVSTRNLQESTRIVNSWPEWKQVIVRTAIEKHVYKDSGVPVHRRVAEKKIGGPICEGRVGHHKDGNKQNNNPDNLQVMSRSSHAKLKARKRKKGK